MKYLLESCAVVYLFALFMFPENVVLQKFDIALVSYVWICFVCSVFGTFYLPFDEDFRNKIKKKIENRGLLIKGYSLFLDIAMLILLIMCGFRPTFVIFLLTVFFSYVIYKACMEE